MKFNFVLPRESTGNLGKPRNNRAQTTQINHLQSPKPQTDETRGCWTTGVVTRVGLNMVKLIEGKVAFEFVGKRSQYGVDSLHSCRLL